MDLLKLKLYTDGERTKEFLKTYFSPNAFKDETIKFIMDSLFTALNTGNFKGKTVYDISISSIVHQLMVASEFCSKITVLKQDEASIMEINNWLNSCTGAFDWAYASDYLKKLACTSDQEDSFKKEKLKKSIQFVKFDLQKANPTDPVVLEEADCIITAWLLDLISQDQSEYIKNFQKMTTLLKPGGLLIVIGCLNTTYFKVGEDKHHVFTYNECFLRENLANGGFKIDTCKVLDTKMQSDLTDYKQFVFVTAVKGAA